MKMLLRVGLIASLVALLSAGGAQAQYANLHSFAGNPDGATPYGSLTVSGTNLYGITYAGGSGDGMIFEMNADGSGYTNLHTFVGAGGDGSTPYGSLTLSGTNLYGMTYYGGVNQQGVVFTINTDGSGYTNLYEFGNIASDGHGTSPLGGSLKLSGTNLYGMTLTGGLGLGVVFRLNTDGSGYTNLHEFGSISNDGGYPRGSLTLSGTNLYGMTYWGGNVGNGVVFALNTDGSGYTNLYNFGSNPGDGLNPMYGDLMLSGTNLYGMTPSGGGGSAGGVVFTINTDGSGYTNLYEFGSNPGDGANPFGSLTLSNSTLYGMAYGGGGSSKGVVFTINTDGLGYTNLYNFGSNPGDGANPFGSLTLSGTNLYGMTSAGGTSNKGVVFVMALGVTPQPTLTITTPYGVATPLPGTYTNIYGTVLTNAVTSPDDQGTTQYVCTGGAIVGLDPASYTQVSATNITLTLTNDATLTWLWATNYWLAPTSTSVNGSVNVVPGWWPVNSNVTITATASNGYHFVNWTGSLTSTNNPIAVTMTQPYALQANFAINTNDITSSAGANGTISPLGTIWVPYNGSTNFIITPNTNYHITNVVVDGSSIGVTNSYTFLNVTNGGQTVAAFFGINQYTLNVTSPWGNPTLAGTTTNNWNALIIASVNSPITNGSTQYVCVGWTGSGSVTSGSGTNTSFNLTNNSTLTWQWVINSPGSSVTNLALASLGSTITGSNGKNWGKLIDGITNGYTTAAGFGYTIWKGVSGAPGSMTLDLKRTCTINSMKLLLWDGDSRYNRYKIEASQNGSTWISVVDHTGAQYQDRSWTNLSLNAPVGARYLRLTGTYSSTNQYFCVVEWQVFGSVGYPAGSDIALASLGSTITGSNGKNWGKLIDGITNGYTTTAGFGYTIWKGVSGAPGSITLDLKRVCTINDMRLLLWDGDNRYNRYKIQASQNGTTWTSIVDHTGGQYYDRSWTNLNLSTPVGARYLRLTGTLSSTNQYFCVVEWQVYESSVNQINAGPNFVTPKNSGSGVGESELPPAPSASLLTGNPPAKPAGKIGVLPVDVLTSGGSADYSNGWNVVDGDTNTIWQGHAGAGGWWIALVYDPVLSVSNVGIDWAEGSLTNLHSLYSTDATNWSYLYPPFTNGPVKANYLWLVFPADKTDTNRVPLIREIWPE
jgi:uncharacterized repeat protein (TIGR03803 family)